MEADYEPFRHTDVENRASSTPEITNSNESDWEELAAPDVESSSESNESDIVASQKIGQAALSAEGIIKGHEFDANKRFKYSKGEIRRYHADRYAENLDYLGKISADSHVCDTYKMLMSDFPELRSVRLTNCDDDNAFSNIAFPVNGEYSPLVCFNFKKPDVYLVDKVSDESDLRGMYSVMVQIALRTGAMPRDIRTNRDLVSAFVLAHEFGHEMDFRRRFLDPEAQKARNSGASGEDIYMKALPEAVAASSQSRVEDMAAGLANIRVSGETELKSIYHSRFEDFDTKTKQEVNTLMDTLYRSSPSESAADTFAVNFILKHFDHFFRKPGDHIPTYIDGEMYEAPEELIPLLDLHSGKRFKTSFYGKDGKRRGSGSFYLQDSLRYGEPLRLNADGDADNQKRDNLRDCGTVDKMYLRNFKDKNSGKVYNFFLTKMKDGSYVEFSRMEKAEAPIIECDANEFLQKYGIQEGSRLGLLKRRLGQGESSNVGTGAVLFGRLTKNHSGKLIGVGDQILLQPDSKHGSAGGKTSGVKKIYRQWRRYYAQTETSVYELMPYKE